jgi:hypothetical protein
MVSGGYEHEDQVPRKLAFEAAHQNVEILYRGAYWKAVVRGGTGETVVTRIELRELLDRLDELTGGGQPN